MTVSFTPTKSSDVLGPACTTDSRSTSTGSWESGNTCPTSFQRSLPSASRSKLPEYDYPVPVIVRNTFIETNLGRPESLDEFFEERRIRSCPDVALANDSMKLREPQSLHRGVAAGAQSILTQLAAATGFWSEAKHEAAEEALQPRRHVLMLSEALPETGICSSQLPTLGSAGHHLGTCKPCAFLYTKGCENGINCTFCHLCPPDEKRRRQKEKQATFREMRRQRRQVRL